MFEDSLMESGGQIKTKSKYWMIGTFIFNGAILGTMILIPLLYPEALPKTAMTAMLTAPPPPPPPPAQIVKPIKMVSEVDQGLHAPTKIPKDIKMLKEDAAPPPQMAGVAGMSGMGSGSGVAGGVLGGIGSAPVPVVKVAKPAGPARVSSGVINGLAISQTKPVYPPIARAAHVSGAVVLHAMISKAGVVENLQVISGPEMLRAAALDAVRTWRYKPYLLNGEPTEVETTVTVNFNMGG